MEKGDKEKRKIGEEKEMVKKMGNWWMGEIGKEKESNENVYESNNKKDNGDNFDEGEKELDLKKIEKGRKIKYKKYCDEEEGRDKRRKMRKKEWEIEGKGKELGKGSKDKE